MRPRTVQWSVVRKMILHVSDVREKGSMPPLSRTANCIAAMFA
jgi:hypothetical protein